MDPNLLYSNIIPDNIRENEKVDIWAIGIITLELFNHKVPFFAFTMDHLKNILQKGLFIIDLKNNKKISKQLLSFINMCMQRDQKIRANVDDLLFSEFITRDPKNFDYIDANRLNEIVIPQPNYVQGSNIVMSIDDRRQLNIILDS